MSQKRPNLPKSYGKFCQGCGIEGTKLNEVEKNKLAGLPVIELINGRCCICNRTKIENIMAERNLRKSVIVQAVKEFTTINEGTQYDCKSQNS